LLTKCVQVIENFDPKKTTVDAYVSDTPILKDKRVNDLEQKFIHQVFYGATRYQKFLKLFVTSFLYKCPTSAVRSDQSLYTILAYLLFFRLEELEVSEFRELLRCGLGTDSALLALMQYALSVEDLENWVKVEWCKLYDVDFIENEVIGKLQSFPDELLPVVEEVELKATGTVASADSSLVKTRKVTEQKPFNLTKVKPRLVPEPDVISRQVKAVPMPAHIHKVSLGDVEEEKKQRLEEHREMVKQKYDGEDGPQLQSAQRVDASEREELTRKVDAERMAECTFRPAPAKKYVRPTEEAVVRQTAGAILREDALLKKKQQNECQILKRYEEDLHDASEFHHWQQNMKEKDDMEEEARVRQRMVEMQLAREEAMEAFDAVKRKKNIMAQHQKELSHQKNLEVEMENAVELQQKQVLCQEVQDDRERARISEAHALTVKAKHAEDLRKEKEAEAARRRREEQFEMEKRKDLIRQIRALEKVPVERFVAFDPAEPPCHGLMEEMSLAELRERMKILEAQKSQEREDKRERQLTRKLEKQEVLAEKAETLGKVREVAREEAQHRHAQRKSKEVEVADRKKAYQAKCIEEAAEKIATKKKLKHEEEQRLKKELKEISTKAQFLQANAEMVEAKAHGEQHRGLEREARDRQKGMLTGQRKVNEISGKEADIRTVNRVRDIEEYKAMQGYVTQRVKQAKASQECLREDIKRANTAARNHQKSQEIRQREDFGHSSNRYMQKVQQRIGSAPPVLNRS